jgi:hypothetical protein
MAVLVLQAKKTVAVTGRHTYAIGIPFNYLNVVK